MKIRLDKAIVEFIPENDIETAELKALWVRMSNCVGNTKQLEPIGVYTPEDATVKNSARFHIEGLTEQELTPGTFETAFSTRALHAAQLIPVTIYCSISLSFLIFLRLFHQLL